MILPFLIGAGALMWLAKRSSTAPNALTGGTASASSDPFAKAVLPADVKGNHGKTADKVKNGHTYRVAVWAIQNKKADGTGGRQFAVVQLLNTSAWLSYWHDVSTKKRKLYRAYAPGSTAAADKLCSTMLKDWGVTR